MEKFREDGFAVAMAILRLRRGLRHRDGERGGRSKGGRAAHLLHAVQILVAVVAVDDERAGRLVRRVWIRAVSAVLR